MGNIGRKRLHPLVCTKARFETNPSNEDKISIINDVCSLLVLVTSDVQQTSILTELKDKYKKASVWKAALADAARKKTGTSPSASLEKG